MERTLAIVGLVLLGILFLSHVSYRISTKKEIEKLNKSLDEAIAGRASDEKLNQLIVDTSQRLVKETEEKNKKLSAENERLRTLLTKLNEKL